VEVWIGLATVLVGAIATGILTYVNVRSRRNAELRSIEARRLRDLRLPHYQRLFELSGVIVEGDTNVEDDWRVQPGIPLARLRSWYFHQAAGMFLTPAARARYFQLIQEMQSGVVVVRHGSMLTEDEAHKICVLAQRLRFQLTEDVAVGLAPDALLPPADTPALS